MINFINDADAIDCFAWVRRNNGGIQFFDEYALVRFNGQLTKIRTKAELMCFRLKLDNKFRFKHSANADQKNNENTKTQEPKKSTPPHPTASAAEDPYETIQRLKSSGRKLIEQRDTWKAKAADLQAQIENIRINSNSGNHNRWGELRKFIANEFHPDKNNASGIERLIKEEVFKILWGKISELEKNG